MQCGRFKKYLSATIKFSAKFCIFYILVLTNKTYRSPLSKRKKTHSGVGGKKQSNDLAVTLAHISWCLSPGLYGRRIGASGKEILVLYISMRNCTLVVPKVMGALLLTGLTWFITMLVGRRFVDASYQRRLFFPGLITRV